MKLLLDESIPRQLQSDFPGFVEVTTVPKMGWAGTKNGALMRLAADAGFDALVTSDRGIEFQHNPESLPLPLPVVVLSAVKTRRQELQPLVPDVIKLVQGGLEPRVYHVGR